MKTLSFKVFFVLLAFLSGTIQGCRKEPVEPEPAVSRDLQYVGNWSGTTSQGKAIGFTIENRNGTATVTDYSITVNVSGSGWSATEIKFGSISAAVSNGKFAYSSSSFDLSGSFSSSGMVSGDFETVSAGPPGYSNGSASGTYSAAK